MKTANQSLFDSSVNRGILVSRYAYNMGRRIERELEKWDKVIADGIARDLRRAYRGGEWDPYGISRTVSGAHQRSVEAGLAIYALLRPELDEFAQQEARSLALRLTRAIPKPARELYPSIRGLDPDQATSLIAGNWAFGTSIEAGLTKGFADSRSRKVEQRLRLGVVEERQPAKMIQEVVGSRSLAFTDGELAAGRRALGRFLTSSVFGLAARVREQVAKANAEMIQAQQWVSVLDPRTTPHCVSRDSLLYTISGEPIGHTLSWGAGPGLFHYNCRSISALVMATPAELGITREQLNGLTQEVREAIVGGPIRRVSYKEWLAKQGARELKLVLGVKRYSLLREGKLPMERFFDHDGDFISLRDLARAESRAFKRAGLPVPFKVP